MNKDLKNYDIHSEIGNFLDTIPASLRKESIEEYKKFLQLKILMKDTKTPAILSPCEFVDIVWHTHLLMPIKYSEFCKQVFGQIIDHDLAGSKSSEDEKSLRLERYGIMVFELFKVLFFVCLFDQMAERISTRTHPAMYGTYHLKKI